MVAGSPVFAGPQQQYATDPFESFLHTLNGALLQGGVQRPYSTFLVHRIGHFLPYHPLNDPANKSIIDEQVAKTYGSWYL